MSGSSIAWVGPGLAAFAGSSRLPAAGGAPDPLPPGPDRDLRLPCRVDGLTAFLDAPGRGRAPDLLGAVREYFEAGGGSLLVVDYPRLADPSAAWIGEDGGPGYRTGIHAAGEMDEAGTIVLAGDHAPRVRDLILDLARRRPDLFFFLEERRPPGGDPGPADLVPLLDNVAILRRPPWRAAEEPPGLGSLVAYLEATDFRETIPFRPVRPSPPPWLSREGEAWLRERRRQEGLRRSLEMGTRSALFDLHHPLTWRRVERDVAAFLLRLDRRGLIERGGAGPRFEVSCEPFSRTEEGPGPGAREEVVGLSIRVRAILARLESSGGGQRLAPAIAGPAPAMGGP